MREFLERYEKLSELDQKNFTRLTNKLILVNFLSNQKETDLKDYYFIIENFSLFRSYFSFMDCELNYDATMKVIALYNNHGSNRLNLKLNESIILLILRLLYDIKMKEVSLIDKVIITLEMIHNEFIACSLQDRRVSKTELKQILNLFKHYNLIEIVDNDFSLDDARIILYPTLLYAVNIEDICRLYDKLSTYKR